jgi:DNA-binding NarL/FixJ family response regulator
MERAVETIEQDARADVLTERTTHPARDPVTLLYFDHRALTRDCVAAQLAALLPEFSVESLSSAFEIRGMRPLGRQGCIIFHAHSLRIDSTQVSEQLTFLREVLSGVPIVVFSNLELAENVVDAVRYGAVAYIPTSLPLRAASEAIRLVQAGCSVLPITSPPVSERVAPEVHAMLDRAGRRVHLTPRQLAVLRELGLGKQNKMIAYDLHMSEGTVKVHVKHIMRKLHVNNRTEAVLILQRGLRQASADEAGALDDADLLRERC